jgi:ferrous iron transport protein A
MSNDMVRFEEQGLVSPMKVPLLSMKRGDRGRIARLIGGPGFQSNLRARGIREGKMIIVIQIQPWGGPVLINVEGEQVALGRGMAHNIIVDIPRRRGPSEKDEPSTDRSPKVWRKRRRNRHGRH